MSHFTNLAVTGITVSEPFDGFDEDMANAFLLLLRDGLSDLMTEWKADAFAFIRAQDGGLSQFFGTAEYAAAVKVVESDLDWFHFDDTISDLFMPQVMDSSAAAVFAAPEAAFNITPVELVGMAFHSTNVLEFAC